MSDSHNGPTTLTAETLNTPFAEAYRTLRANINFSSIDAPVRTLVVTSAAPAEGKTTTVVNLGIIMAQAGHSVVLVDADFRRPSLHHYLGASGRPAGGDGGKYLGLSNVIVGATTLQSRWAPSTSAHRRTAGSSCRLLKTKLDLPCRTSRLQN